MIRRLLRWTRYDRGVTMDPDYEIVPVADLPAAPATPVAVTDPVQRPGTPEPTDDPR